MITTALTDLWYGFGVALEPQNLMWCFIGVLIGNMVGVLPGMGPLATISILLPLTFGIKPVGAILMLAGVMYGAQYGGAICSILLNLPCHPPHAVTCLDGYPMTKQGRGGVALCVTVFSSFVGASWGITEMVFLAPILVRVALQFGPAEICTASPRMLTRISVNGSGRRSSVSVIESATRASCCMSCVCQARRLTCT